MWNTITHLFKDAPSKLKIVKLIIESGLRIGVDSKIYCGDIEIPATKIAAAVNVDRRVVKETAESILKTEGLRDIFMNFKPAGPLLKEIAKYVGYGVVEIRAQPEAQGIIAETTALIAKQGISIRQILAEDPEIYPDPKLTIITERLIPGELLPQFLKIPTVKQVTIT